MKCFNHPDIAAVGLCKHCSKGLCKDCLTDLEHGIACKNLHEAQVESINSLVIRNASVSKAAPKNIWIMPMFYLFMGIIFIGLGLIKDKSLISFPILMGSGFTFFGVVLYFRYKAAYKDI
jgi:hypothetical protein